PFAHVEKYVRPVRAENNRKIYREHWWIHGEARPAMLQSLRALPRFIATPRVSKHRVFVWISPEYLPSDATVAFARDDDYFFGILHSRFHEVWALKLGTRLETRPRYTPTTCFETFPLPEPNEQQKINISAAAKELNELREETGQADTHESLQRAPGLAHECTRKTRRRRRCCLRIRC